MDPNDSPDAPFSSQPLPDPKKMHICRAGCCVILVSGGTVTSKSRRAIKQFLDQHNPEKR